jgi:hypothetical protein
MAARRCLAPPAHVRPELRSDVAALVADGCSTPAIQFCSLADGAMAVLELKLFKSERGLRR